MSSKKFDEKLYDLIKKQELVVTEQLVELARANQFFGDINQHDASKNLGVAGLAMTMLVLNDKMARVGNWSPAEAARVAQRIPALKKAIGAMIRHLDSGDLCSCPIWADLRRATSVSDIKAKHWATVMASAGLTPSQAYLMFGPFIVWAEGPASNDCGPEIRELLGLANFDKNPQQSHSTETPSSEKPARPDTNKVPPKKTRQSVPRPGANLN
jgi:hypothetical protein